MTGYSRGDVVLVGFVFTDETGVRQRPAVIISSDAYHRGREEVIIAAITSRTDRVLVGDHLISDWRQAIDIGNVRAGHFGESGNFFSILIY